MFKKVLKTEMEVRDFVRGCTLYGSGGGGLAENGLDSLLTELRAGKEIGWVDVNDIADDAITVCPFLMGSIAPHTPEVKKEMEGFGLTDSKYTEKQRIAESIKELSKYMGKKIDAVVPLELGGASTPGGIAAGLVNGLPAVDGDYTGRAIPEIPQTTPYLHGIPLWPLSVVDEFGNVSVIKHAINYRIVERIGKQISAAAYGLTGDTGFLMTGKEMKKAIIPGTLTECYELGKMIREAREAGEDPVKAVADKLEGWILIKGKVTKKETEDKLGYYWGTHTIEGSGEYAGQVMKIWFKNENHVAWNNDKVVATSPDMITVVSSKDGEPITNPKLKVGDEVAVLGIKARSMFRTEKGVGILGPRYFGFDFDYVPIEDLLK
ncbi:MAG: DUF917 domain-containing protein [Thermoanaerobacterales bacterium]|nr:DUF917 domain-containing protein [Thermoanaerobacterales bacterium]